MTDALCMEFFGAHTWKAVVEPGAPAEGPAPGAALAALARLRAGEPLQYVLGHALFCGRRFNVGPGVLIPRPETEGLCSIAMEYARLTYGVLKILDLCTGSGCIAWTLAKEIPGADVTGIEVSEDALKIAGGQFGGEGAPHFIQGDIFDDRTFEGLGSFDIVVSNPPYIMESERAQMRPNVLDHEPAQALFVPDGDPMCFNSRIAALCAEGLLAEGGICIVEINEKLPEESCRCFASHGFTDVEIRPDIFGKPRFAVFRTFLKK